MKRPLSTSAFARGTIRGAACVLAVTLASGSLAAPGGAARGETLTLADCLRETAEHNPDILAQQAGIQQATAERLVLRARALPKFSVGGLLGYLGARTDETLQVPVTINGKKTIVDVTTARPATEAVIGAEDLGQPIFDAAIPASFRRGTIGITVAQENFYTVASAQLYQTRIFFYQALFQQENGEVLRGIDRSFGGEVKSLDQLVTAGLVGRQSLLAAQVQRTNFGTSLLANTGSVQTGLTSLLQNMGRNLGPAGTPGSPAAANIHLAGELDTREISFDAPAMAREALAHRPDIRALRATVRQANEDANIVRGGYYPTVRLYLDGELVPNTFVQRTGSNSERESDQTQTTELRPGVQANWTIIDTGLVRGTVNNLQAGRDAILVALQQAERNLPSDFALLRAQMTGAANRINALQSNVGVAQDTLNTVQSGVAQGVNTQIELFDAQNGVLSARSGLLAAELDMSVAHAEFDRLTGRYLHFTNEAPAAAAHHDPAHQ